MRYPDEKAESWRVLITSSLYELKSASCVCPGGQMAEETHCLCGWSSRQHARAQRNQDPPVNEGFPPPHTHVHTRAHTHMCAHMCSCTCTYMHACTCTCTGAHTHVRTHILPLSAHLTMNACSRQCKRGQHLPGLKICPVSQGNAVTTA